MVEKRRFLGQCSDLTDGGYKCTCSTNFTGLQCQTKQTKCQINTCKNDSRCIITEITLHSQTTTTQQHSQKCLCQKGFTGLDCSEKEVISLINQQSKSLPISSPNSKNLLSSPDSSKLFQSHCDINPCLNGATCYERKGGASPSSSFVCRCVPGFTGSLCQIDIPDCRARPCSNGGTCTDLINDYSCNCPPGFEGKDCSVTVLIERKMKHWL
ncbi:delta-like protein 4 [Gordionus sp. m RMFG-2023]|uniref:delta-like protein 4 n=1 Tax=Gordionus sp. m RMFG-2023 TaxID=3053472 RepID=UPI0031FD6309